MFEYKTTQAKPIYADLWKISQMSIPKWIIHFDSKKVL